MARFDFKGYSFKTWALKNKNSLKLIISGIFGLTATFVSGLSPTWNVPLGGLVATVSKLALDAFDYWQSE